MPVYIEIPDERGRVYCRLLERTVTFGREHTERHCATCPMFAGTAQGEGVECFVEDSGGRERAQG